MIINRIHENKNLLTL